KEPAATPRASVRPLGRRTPRAGSAIAAGLACSGHPQLLLDAGHDALLGVEELVRDRAPAAELRDVEQLLRGREPLRVDQALVDRAVALRGVDLLSLRRLEEVHERLRLLRVARLLRGRDRVLDQDRLVGDHVVELDALLLSG